jgi:hypothetical protein
MKFYKKKVRFTAERAECAETESPFGIFSFSLFFFLSALSANSAVKKLLS